jgi:hypothetical protein
VYLVGYYDQNFPDTITPVGDTETWVVRLSLLRFEVTANQVALPAKAAIPMPP